MDERWIVMMMMVCCLFRIQNVHFIKVVTTVAVVVDWWWIGVILIMCLFQFRLRTTRPFVRHHPVEEHHHKDHKQNHVAHVLSRARF